MAILREEAWERIRKRRLAGDFKPKPTPKPSPSQTSIEGDDDERGGLGAVGDVAGTMLRGYERAGRLAGILVNLSKRFKSYQAKVTGMLP